MKYMGTNLGFLIHVNLKDSNKLVKRDLDKNFKINQLYLQQGIALFSVSDNGLLRMYSMVDDLGHFYIDAENIPQTSLANSVRKVELTCFCLRFIPFIHRNAKFIEFFIGNAQGKLIHCKRDLLFKPDSKTKDNSTKEIIFDNPAEGPITGVQCNNDLVVYSTATRVRIIHYEKKQKICMIEKPDTYPTFPENIHKTIKPTFLFRRAKIGDE